MTKDQIALLIYIKQANIKSLEWLAEDPNSRGVGLTCEDIDYWAEQGINTVDQYVHQNLAIDAFELYRSVYGYKPNYGELNAMSNEALEEMISDMKNDSSKYL